MGFSEPKKVLEQYVHKIQESLIINCQELFAIREQW